MVLKWLRGNLCGIYLMSNFLMVGVFITLSFYSLAAADPVNPSPKTPEPDLKQEADCPECRLIEDEIRQKTDLIAQRNRKLEELNNAPEKAADTAGVASDLDEAAHVKNHIAKLEEQVGQYRKELRSCKEKCNPKTRGSMPSKPKKEGPSKSLEPSATPPPLTEAGCPECQEAEKELAKAKAAFEQAKKDLKEAEDKQKALEHRYKDEKADVDELRPMYHYLPKDSKSPEQQEFFRRWNDANVMERETKEELWENSGKISSLQNDIEDLSKKVYKAELELGNCKEKCTPPACPIIPFQPITIGPQSTFGSGFSKVVQDTAKQIVGGLLGGFLGGRGGGSDPSDSPPLVSNPISEMSIFTDPETGAAIKLGAKQTEKGPLLAAGVEKGDGKPTIHSMTLHHDDDCTIMMPDELFLYELWLKWWLTVSWTKTTYVNNQMTKKESGGWSSQGSQLLDRGVFAANNGGEGSIWQYFGFNRATEGPKMVGAQFINPVQGQAKKLPDKAVIHITQPDKDPVKTLPFVFKMVPKPDGTFGFEQVPGLIK